MTSLLDEVVSFLTSYGNGWTVYPWSEIKSLDLQRTGNVMVVTAPTITGRAMGIGEGMVGGSYTQQQISDYEFGVTVFGTTEVAVVLVTDWIAQNVATSFLNVSFTGGVTVLGKMIRYGQVLNERGTWKREIRVMVEALLPGT